MSNPTVYIVSILQEPKEGVYFTLTEGEVTLDFRNHKQVKFSDGNSKTYTQSETYFRGAERSGYLLGRTFLVSSYADAEYLIEQAYEIIVSDLKIHIMSLQVELSVLESIDFLYKKSFSSEETLKLMNKNLEKAALPPAYSPFFEVRWSLFNYTNAVLEAKIMYVNEVQSSEEIEFLQETFDVCLDLEEGSRVVEQICYENDFSAHDIEIINYDENLMYKEDSYIHREISTLRLIPFTENMTVAALDLEMKDLKEDFVLDIKAVLAKKTEKYSFLSQKGINAFSLLEQSFLD